MNGEEQHVMRPLTVAVAQPICVPKNLQVNASEHARMICQAGARLVVFPELSLTGYELDADPIALNDTSVAIIAGACRRAGAIALVGAPVAGRSGRVHIGTLLIGPGRVAVAYRKSYLGDDESARFVPGSGAVVLRISGWRVGLGICKDTGVDRHIADVAELGIDLYAAGLVLHAHELPVQEQRAANIARTCNSYVAFASFAGSTGGGYACTVGESSIWSKDGRAISRAGAEPGHIASVTLGTAEP